MKKQILSIIFIFSFLQQSFSQNPLVKQWDKRFGGTSEDAFSSFQQTKDGGYILGGSSWSPVSGDKTEASWGFYDYWIIKIDSVGNKQWDSNFGGANYEELHSLQQTSDGGFIIGGWSDSGISGEKTQASHGGYDYWIVKTDSLGNKQWDKDFGGTDNDFLYSLIQTTDGGYMLAGYSYSDSSGDKTQPNWDTTLSFGDYWIVKIDSLGTKQWDKDFGGINGDDLYSIIKTNDGGYMLGGYSQSDSSGDKTQPGYGMIDYWIVKIDSLGNKQWDKDFGGTGNDNLSSIQQTADMGYILGGWSLSGIGGNKTTALWGGINSDWWILKTDSTGNIQWQKDFGGTSPEDEFGNIFLTPDGGYLFAGTSYSGISGDKTENNLGAEQTWIVKTDSLGNKQWDKTLHTNTSGDDETGLAIKTKDGCYTMANWTDGGVGGDKTQPNWNATNTTADYWIIKFCDSTSTTSITQLPNTQLPFTIYPNPAKEYVIINYHFKAGDEIRLTDVLGKLLYTTKITVPTLNFKLQTLNLSPGIYFLKAGNEVRKFVKE